MLRRLRTRFILSHVLPLLIIVPLMGLALIYVLETKIFLPELAGELSSEAELVAEIAGRQPSVWTHPGEARAFVDRVGRTFDARLMLVSLDGRILASSDPRDARRVGQHLTHPGLSRAAAGALDVRTVHQRRPDVEVVDVLAPAHGPTGAPAGVVRLTHLGDTVIGEFVRRRNLIAAVLGGGVLLGIALGWVLATNLERPLEEVTRSVRELAEGQRWTTLPESRLEEIGQLERAFNSLVERLRGLEDARGRLLANLVHELGRPLGALHSAVQALRAGADEDAALRRELLAGIAAEIDRLGRLTEDLTRLHAQVLGALELSRRAVPISEWLSQVLAPWREAALHKGLHWTASVPSDLPAAQIDPDRLAQAVGNLLSNAIKFTPAGGSVSVAAGGEDGTVWIRVADTGAGIPPDEHQQIFEPFYRGQGGRRFPQGMGLGLTIARDVVTAHAGRLELDTGGGSRFTIRIPIRPDQAT